MAMNKSTSFSGEWKNADRIVELVEPGEVVEIDMGHVSHFVFNIKRGWCVHVISSVADGLSAARPKYVVKDATDLSLEAGTFPCRVYDFEKEAQENKLIPRSLKDALQISRAGLAQGPVQLPLSDITPIDDFKNISKEFCIYWKFTQTLDKQSFHHWNWTIIAGILIFVIAAGTSTMLLA